MAIPNLAVGDVVRTATVVRTLGQAGINSGGFRIVSQVGSGLSIQSSNQAWAINLLVGWGSVVSVHADLVATIMEKINPLSSRVELSDVHRIAFTPGTVLGNLVPSQVAPVIQKLTGFAGPGARGRFYAPFIGDDMLQPDGELTAAAAGALLTAYSYQWGPQSWVIAGNGYTVVPVLIKRGGRLPHALIATDIIRYNVSGKLGTIRRRGDYGKLNPLP